MKTYFISDGTFVKIGKSSDPEKRQISFQTSSSRPLSLLISIVGDWESTYHDIFAADRTRGEWFAWSSAHTDLVFFIVTGRLRRADDTLIDLTPVGL